MRTHQNNNRFNPIHRSLYAKEILRRHSLHALKHDMHHDHNSNLEIQLHQLLPHLLILGLALISVINSISLKI